MFEKMSNNQGAQGRNEGGSLSGDDAKTCKFLNWMSSMLDEWGSDYDEEDFSDL